MSSLHMALSESQIANGNAESPSNPLLEPVMFVLWWWCGTDTEISKHYTNALELNFNTKEPIDEKSTQVDPAMLARIALGESGCLAAKL